jgi:hypothetical protein
MSRVKSAVLAFSLLTSVIHPAAAQDRSVMPVRNYLIYINTAAAQTQTTPDKAFITGLNAGLYLGAYAGNLTMFEAGLAPTYCLADQPTIGEPVFTALFVAYLEEQMSVDQEYEMRLLPAAFYDFLTEEFPCSR